MSFQALKHAGYCHCCRSETIFESQHEWLRDYYVCTKCFSTPRERHLQLIHDQVFGGWEALSIHESSPSNDFIARHSKNYSSSQFLEDVPFGEVRDGTRSETLEHLTYPDSSFDLVITKDVFEHVMDPAAAARDIARVLKPGGAHVFTAPKHSFLARSNQRARHERGEIEYLEEPAYHGNPVGDGRALVTWDYGQDFEELYGKWSGCHVTTYVTRDRQLGLDGEFLEVFVTRRSRSS